MEAVAKLNNCPTSPRKMRLLADLVRGKRVEEAMNILRYNNKKENSYRLEKLLRSAIANWEQKNEGANIESAQLYVKTIFGFCFLKMKWKERHQVKFNSRMKLSHETFDLHALAHSATFQALRVSNGIQNVLRDIWFYSVGKKL